MPQSPLTRRLSAPPSPTRGEGKKRDAGPSCLASYASLAYGAAAFAVMWVFWVAFVVFLINPARLPENWPLPTVDAGGSIGNPYGALAVDLALIAIFGLQHSVMARASFKRWSARFVPAHLERATYVHAANFAALILIVFWQPIPVVLWAVTWPPLKGLLWGLFALGWVILFAGAVGVGMRQLLGLEQISRWRRGLPQPASRLKTGGLYRWMRHPMYVGVLIGLWVTPRMTVGHALLAAGLTLYILIAMRYEERDLARSFGEAYQSWRRKPAGSPHYQA